MVFHQCPVFANAAKLDDNLAAKELPKNTSANSNRGAVLSFNTVNNL